MAANSLKHGVKRTLKRAVQRSKRLIASNKHTHRLAVKTKHLLLPSTGSGQREVYNLSSFYPTITEYHRQTRDFNDKTDPLISILLPTFNTPEEYLRECIESIIVQSYPKWELCIADDSSSDPRVKGVIKEYQAKDTRIKFTQRKKNGHISLASNSALELATGEFVGLMDHDDVLWPNALYEMVKVIRKDKKVDLIYSDEDKIDGSGKIHSYPFLKPDFSPEFLESCNYITHFSCIRTSVMKDIGGFRKGYEGAQDWDLFIRISEVTQNIVHIPKLLYSWRIHETSTASNTDAKPYVYEAQKKLLTDHILRTGRSGVVMTGLIPQHRTIRYDIAKDSLLTVLIEYTTLEATLRLINSLTTHKSGAKFEIIVLTDALSPPDEKKVLSAAKGARCLCMVADKNKLMAATKGNYTMFVKDCAEIITDDWAHLLIADAQTPGVGLVTPVFLDQTKKIVLGSGIGLGYGAAGIDNMLAGISFDDPHYTRGLYVKSRRNVSAVNSTLFAVETKLLTRLLQGKATLNDSVAMSLKLLEDGFRQVYTPYVQVVVHGALPTPAAAGPKTDKYLNINFNSNNPRMEVRA